MDKILLMLQLQAQLNESTNGSEWVKGITKNGKEINWNRCIYMECAEMIDSFAWKHWKNIDAKVDWDNLKIEVVDVWHFIMSLIIQDYNQNLKGGIEDIAIHISNMECFSNIDLHNEQHNPSPKEIMQKIESIIKLSLDDKLDTDMLIEQFFDLVIMSGLDLQTLYKLYVGKNILNQFRQDNGYKNGSYIKIWDGEEDNVVMKRLWEANSNLKPDELYKKLAKLYHAINK